MTYGKFKLEESKKLVAISAMRIKLRRFSDSYTRYTQFTELYRLEKELQDFYLRYPEYQV